MSLLKNIGRAVSSVGKVVGSVSKVPVLGPLLKTVPVVGTVLGAAELVGGVARAAGGFAGGQPAPPRIPPPPAGYPTTLGPQYTAAGIATMPKLPPGVVGKIGKGVAVGLGTLGAADLARRAFGSEPRKRRSTNYMNPKALSRAHRRIEGFSNQSRKVLREIGISVSATRRPPIRKRG